MMTEFFRFELRYWLRGVMVYIFLAVMTLMFFSATSSDQVTVGQALGNTHRNAPYVIQMFYGVSSILCCLMVTAFVDSAASRDFAFKSSDLVFSKPVSKGAYIFGRFLAASLVAVIPTLGVSLGVLLAGFNPWIDASRWGEFSWTPHLLSILLFAIPNTLFIGAVVFAISVLTRSTLYSFIGTLGFLVAYAISSTYLEDMDNQNLGALLDPFGVSALSIATKYWAVEEKNTLTVGFTNLMLANRGLWLAVTAAIMSFAYWRFQFAEMPRRREKSIAEPETSTRVDLPSLFVQPRVDGFVDHFGQFISHLKNDIRGVIRSTVFLVLAVACLINMIPQVWFDATSSYGQSTFPVTYHQIDLIRGSGILFWVAIITFFAGVLTWRDRDVRCNEILGALPYPNWTAFLSRFLTLAIIIQLLFLLGITVSVLAQLAAGYTRLQLGVYVQELLVIDFAKMCFLAILAFLMHSLAPNKYIGYFLFILALIGNGFGMSALRVESNLFRFGRLPGYTYSDMFGIQPYTSGLWSFGIYWIVFCLMLAWLTTLIAHRGIAAPLSSRLRHGFRQLSPLSMGLATLFAVTWVGLGGWLYYNTHVVNKLIGSKEIEVRRADYEKRYKETDKRQLPKITTVKYEIDIHPQERNLFMKGTQQLVNKSDGPISEVLFTLSPEFETTIEIAGATQTKDDKRLAVREFTFEPPMQPGESRLMSFDLRRQTRGIENSVTLVEVNQNGTFFNNQIAPRLGYSAEREISDPNTRKSNGLPKTETFPPLTREKGEPCMRHYVAESDWVEIETVISTSGDQTAVARGRLSKNGKRTGAITFAIRLTIHL